MTYLTMLLGSAFPSLALFCMDYSHFVLFLLLDVTCWHLKLLIYVILHAFFRFFLLLFCLTGHHMIRSAI